MINFFYTLLHYIWFINLYLNFTVTMYNHRYTKRTVEYVCVHCPPYTCLAHLNPVSILYTDNTATKVLSFLLHLKSGLTVSQDGRCPDYPPWVFLWNFSFRSRWLVLRSMLLINTEHKYPLKIIVENFELAGRIEPSYINVINYTSTTD